MDGEQETKIFGTFAKYEEFSATQSKFLQLCQPDQDGWDVDEADALVGKLSIVVRS